MKENRTKVSLQQGQAVVGTFVREFASPEVGRILDEAGYDFFVLDNEHNAFTTREIVDIARVSKYLSISCLVRVPDGENSTIAKTLDLGADGIVVPRIRTPADALIVTQAALYPPDGLRGVGFRAVNVGYSGVDNATAMSHSNKNTLVVLQIETREALDNVDEIAALPGVDVTLIGPTDLGVALRDEKTTKEKKIAAAATRVIGACKEGNASPGIVGKPASARDWKERGMLFLICSNEVSMLLQAARDAAQVARG